MSIRKNKSEVSSEIADKITKYVYDNYKSYKDKTLYITENNGVYGVRKHINGSFLFLSKNILN